MRKLGISIKSKYFSSGSAAVVFMWLGESQEGDTSLTLRYRSQSSRWRITRDYNFCMSGMRCNEKLAESLISISAWNSFISFLLGVYRRLRSRLNERIIQKLFIRNFIISVLFQRLAEWIASQPLVLSASTRKLQSSLNSFRASKFYLNVLSSRELFSLDVEAVKRRAPSVGLRGETLVIIIVCKWIKGLNAPTNIINDLRTETSVAWAKRCL